MGPPGTQQDRVRPRQSAGRRFQDDDAGEQIENTIIRSDNCDTAKVTA
jgi:hypothetical protein